MDYSNMPKLSIALNKYEEYVHINDVDEERRKKEVFKCPVCGGKVKARCVSRKTVKQPHFYHIEESCSNESMLHWMYKNWLLREGSKVTAKCKDKYYEFTVDKIEIEKSHNTKLGKYKPDATIYTTDGKVVYLEVKYSSGKSSEMYYSKWQELGNDVISVDVKKEMYENNKELIADILYSDNVCYIKNYNAIDRDFCSYKGEISRQEKLNYKARVEQLDWLFYEFQKYRRLLTEESKELVLESFKALDKDDMEFVFNFIKKHNVGDLKGLIEIEYDNVLYDGIWDKYFELENICNKFYDRKMFSLSKGRKYFTFIDSRYYADKTYGDINIAKKIETIKKELKKEIKDNKIKNKAAKDVKRVNEIFNNNISMLNNKKRFENNVFEFRILKDHVSYKFMCRMKIEYLNSLLDEDYEYSKYYDVYNSYCSKYFSLHTIYISSKDFLKDDFYSYIVKIISDKYYRLMNSIEKCYGIRFFTNKEER